MVADWQHETANRPKCRRQSDAPQKSNNNNLTEAIKDNVMLDYAGIRASELTVGHREVLGGCWTARECRRTWFQTLTLLRWPWSTA